MFTPLKWYIFPALVIVCILTSWQGICAHPGGYEHSDVTGSAGISIVQPVTQVVTAVDTGISEILRPEYPHPGAYLSLLKTAGYSLRETDPQLTQEEVQTQVENTPIHVDPEDVPTRFPLIPVIVILYTFGVLTALKKETDRKSFPIQPRAITVLAVCFFCSISSSHAGLYRWNHIQSKKR